MDEQIDFQVLEAGTGAEGIELVDREQLEILLLDNKLPDIQGVEVLEYIKNKHYDIVVVMVAASYASWNSQ